MRELVHQLLHELPLGPAALVLLAQNALVFVGALGFGELLVWRFSEQRVAARPPPIERRELILAASTVVLNALITLAGLVLFRAGYIVIREDVGWRALADVAVLLVAMDLAMYALHRLAHVPPLDRLLHGDHHRYDRPRPLTLFVLHPFETLGFGALWLAVLTVYSASWLGIATYLTLNVVFGTVGHLGVEPLPRWVRAPGLRFVAGSTFHAGHHADARHNFGFYTTVWDRLFGTVAPALKR